MSKSCIYPDPEFAERLRAAMVANGITQIELARRIGRERRIVYRWLNSITSPYASDLKKVCYLLHVSSDWLLFGYER